jgi:acetyltransferase-like isoleucine patch superfamily enzyme
MIRALEQFREVARLLHGRFRAALLRLRGARVGGKTRIDRGLVARRPRGIQLGRRVEIEHAVFLKLVDDTARLVVGDSVFIGTGSEIDVASRVTIGAHTLIAPQVFITDHTHNAQAGVLLDQQGILSADVQIGSDVWIGARAVILAGVTIGDGAIVGAGAVVTHDVAPETVVAGVPARLLGRRGAAR